mgnify:FL=1
MNMKDFGRCFLEAIRTTCKGQKDNSLQKEKEGSMVKVSFHIGNDEMCLMGSKSAMQSVAGFLERLSVRIRDSTDRQNL